ncbi:MAG: glycosyltransferase, partial [Spiribacter salinus]
MTFFAADTHSEMAIWQDTARSPRNMWTRCRVALELLSVEDFYGARRLLEGVRYHPDASDEILAIFQNQVRWMQSRQGGGRKINIPADYLGSDDPRLLLPLRRLDMDRTTPKPYPWGLALPPFVGTANDSVFLKEAACALAGQARPSIRRVHVIANLPGERANAPVLGRQLRALAFDGRLDATVFSQTDAGTPVQLTGGGRMAFRDCPMCSPEAQGEIAHIAERADLVVFLSGAVDLDPMALQRAIHLAETSDMVVQPLVAMAEDEGFSTLYSEDPRGRFKSRYPFREVVGLNMVIPARLLRAIGGPEIRLTDAGLAGRELAYRAWVRGAWFVPLVVPGLSEAKTSPPVAEVELCKALCPNHWDRKRDIWREVPKVSVYIPAYNASKYIERAVDSVLAQDVSDLDVCIANDGSRDETLALLERRYGDEARVRWIDNPNGGIGFASNSAIRMSRSLYIGQLDSDDCLKPGAVRRLMEVLDENPSVVCAYGSCERIDAEGNYTQDEYSWPKFSREKMMITSIVHHFRMFRRQAWERTTGFREDIVNGVDYDIFLKMSELGEFRHIEEKLYQRRWHGENTSHVNEHHQTTNTYRVQREALKRQGLARFWDVHVPDPETPRKVTYQLAPGTKMLIFWPDYSRSNPYLRLLYGKLRYTAEVVSGTIDAALRAIDTKTANPADITFHLHWLNAIFRDAKTEAEARAAVDTFIAKLEKFVRQGGQLIWTIHNHLSHDAPFPELETELSARIAATAHKLHFHSAASVEEVAAVFPIDRDKVMVARHGHYIGAYPDYVDRASAREALGFAPQDDVIVFTGQIRPYKGVDQLVTAFRRILADRPQARLVLAGKTDGDPLAAHDLTEAERARITVTGRFVQDAEFQLFFRAADMAAYPYQRILTSGSLLLALSFGVP